MKLTILYRGPLSSCNYACPYCPFAKHQESDEEHARDAYALSRFVQWIEAQRDMEFSVFFTPWGEALIRRRYQQALITLTNLAHVEKVAIQTNGSCRFNWAAHCDKSKLGLWVTYHPGETSCEQFLKRCAQMQQQGIRFSVGVVGLKEHFAEIEALRAALPPGVYLWVNAFKRLEDYYVPDEVNFLTALDPLFPLNNTRHQSLGRACHAGQSVISVDGDGTMRRCHFVKEAIGNIYENDWKNALRPRLCSNQTCGCHIGYVHMNELNLYGVFEGGVLERIPLSFSSGARQTREC
ncbi:MAG TPA: STM4011 family radical SAM protein [Abditibacteriaceae bacterium]|jgi:MoaA/NifB/PqqE/SkfB family radical SAM enzyme